MEASERLAILETKLESLEETNGKILTSLNTMQSDFTRFKGFAGGVLFVASAIGAFIGIIKSWILGGLVPH